MKGDADHPTAITRCPHMTQAGPSSHATGGWACNKRPNVTPQQPADYKKVPQAVYGARGCTGRCLSIGLLVGRQWGVGGDGVCRSAEPLNYPKKPTRSCSRASASVFGCAGSCNTVAACPSPNKVSNTMRPSGNSSASWCAAAFSLFTWRKISVR